MTPSSLDGSRRSLLQVFFAWQRFTTASWLLMRFSCLWLVFFACQRLPGNGPYRDFVHDRPATHGNRLAELFIGRMGSNTLQQLLGCSCGSLACCWFSLYGSDCQATALIETLCMTDLQHTEITLQSVHLPRPKQYTTSASWLLMRFSFLLLVLFA
jgi:hypothetical protein